MFYPNKHHTYSKTGCNVNYGHKKSISMEMLVVKPFKINIINDRTDSARYARLPPYRTSTS